MFVHLPVNQINLGQSVHLTGHEVFLDATYSPNPPENNTPRRLIVKKNKYGYSRFSRFEVAFNQLARLFLAKGLTSHEQLVVDSANQIIGLAVEHLCYVITQREGSSPLFYSLDYSQPDCCFKPVTLMRSEDLPLYFLDRVPQSFFAHLLVAEKEQKVTIDFSSLASIFTSSYTLEEDDLHKGNFGFYLVKKNDLPHAVFFKIDHDLMFVDSIMSFYTRRPYHLLDGKKAFLISANDLLNFPDLADSANSYWPTKKCFLSRCDSNKEYRSNLEVDAFASLKQNPVFCKAKWLSFYKHSLLPVELISHSLEECCALDDPIDRARHSLIVQALVARQAQLRVILFSLPVFREFVNALTKEEYSSLLADMMAFCPLDLSKQISCAIDLSFTHNQILAGECDEGDTPLHLAIRLGDFRYEETMDHFGHLIDIKNKRGQTPLDIALAMYQNKKRLQSKDIRQDLRLTMQYLLKGGAQRSESFNQFNQDEHIESYTYLSSYQLRAQRACTYAELKETLRAIGEDSSYCLKFKKNLAIDCIKLFIKHQQKNPQFHPILVALKRDINGQSNAMAAADLKYLRQLRSRLWIIRQMRGLYGWTSTQNTLNNLLNECIRSSLWTGNHVENNVQGTGMQGKTFGFFQTPPAEKKFDLLPGFLPR